MTSPDTLWNHAIENEDWAEAARLQQLGTATDLSTPEARIERGVYDAVTDPYVTDEMRTRTDRLMGKLPLAP